VEEIALPPPGAKPVPISLLSTRAAEWFNNPKKMLASKEEVMENLMTVPEKPYVDENLNKKEPMLKLASRMAKANMLRAVKDRKGNVGLFTVIKKIEEGPEGPVVTQRLIFDQRRDNAYWKRPPWTGLASPSAISMIDISEEWNEDVEFVVASGDLPNYYYTIELPEWIAEWLCLPIISVAELTT